MTKMRLQLTALVACAAVITCQGTSEDASYRGSPSPSLQHSRSLTPSLPHSFSPKNSHALVPRSVTHKPQHHSSRPPKLPHPGVHHTAKGNLHLKLSNPTSPEPRSHLIHPVSHNTPPYGPHHGHKPPHQPPIHSKSAQFRPAKPDHRPHFAPVYKKPTHPHPHAAVGVYDELPRCSYNSSSTWCLEDPDYPMYEVQGAAQKNSKSFLSLYADVAHLNTGNSVEGLHDLSEETYLCDSATSYVRPLRAVNVDGKWRVIVNEIKVNYEDITQTVRLEECQGEGAPCPLVPKCYASTCAQKFIYQRFLVYDPYDVYFPFAIESFKLPAACSCLLDSFYAE